MKELLKKSVLQVARRSRLVRTTAQFIATNDPTSLEIKDTYRYLRRIFINNGRNHFIGESIRAEIVERFELIDKYVPIGTTPTDGLFLAEMLLNMEAEGPIIECGCYAGGSSSKLSIVSKLLDRELYIFDSFEGLPAVDQYYLSDKHCRRSIDWITDWTEGRYAARLDEVQINIERFGEPVVCSFFEGWFTSTLNDNNLPQSISFAFTDVDLANSARDCFVAIWPRLSEKGIFVTHDTAYIKVLLEFYRPELWRDIIESTPSILFGAGYGLCNDSPHMGYMVKGETLTPDYLKSLTLDK